MYTIEGNSLNSFYSIIFLSTIIYLISCDNSFDQNGETEKDVADTIDIPTGKKMKPVTDIDGQVYQTVGIGKQVWMAEDLKKTKIDCDSNKHVQFTNGLERGPHVKFYDGQPRYAYYNNNRELGYGVIYNFSVLQNCKLCPPEFRIPTKTDWEELVNELGGSTYAVQELRKGGSSGFNAVLGGRIDSYGSGFAGNIGFWWSSDLVPEQYGIPSAYTFEIYYKGTLKIKGQDLRAGNYVRCIKE